MRNNVTDKQTDRQTDRLTTDGSAMAYSKREREFTSAKNERPDSYTYYYSINSGM